MVGRLRRLGAPLLFLGFSSLSAALRHAGSGGRGDGAAEQVDFSSSTVSPDELRERKKRVVLQPGNDSDPFERTYHWDDWQSLNERPYLNLADPVCFTSVGTKRSRCKLVSHRLCGRKGARTASLADQTAFRGEDAKCFKRRKTCAVVGSSHHLLNATYGKRIDEHDVVIRINAAPAGSAGRWATHVGTRTDVRFLNGFGKIPEASESPDPVCLFIAEPKMPEACGKYCWRNPGLCDIPCTGNEPSRGFHRLFCSHDVCDLDEIQCRGVRQPGEEEPDWGQHHVFMDNLYSGLVDLVVPHSTAGFKAVVYAMSICDSVSVLGFGPSCAGAVGDRYYGGDKGILNWHHYEEELALLFKASKLGTDAIVPPEARKWIVAQKVEVVVPHCVDKKAVSQLQRPVRAPGDEALVNLALERGEAPKAAGERQ